MIRLILNAIGILALLGAVAIPVTSFAAEHFVCYSATECNVGTGSGWSTGSPSNDGRSKSSPKQCPKDLSGIAPGDTITLGDGTYSMSRCGFGERLITINWNGTQSEPITFRAENRWGAKFDGQETTPNEDGRRANLVYMENCSHVVVDGLYLLQAKKGLFGHSRNKPCNNMVLKNNKIENMGFSGIDIQLNHHTYLIDSNIIYDIRDLTTHNEDHTCAHNHNMYLNGYNLTLTNNVLHSSGGGTMIAIGGACNLSTGSQDPPGFTHSFHAINNTFDGNGCVVTYTEPSGDKRYAAIGFWNRAFTSAFCSDIGGSPRNYKNVRFENNLMLNGQTASWNGELPQFIGNTNAESVQLPGADCKHFPWAGVCGSRSGAGSWSQNGDPGYFVFKNNVAETRALNPSHQAWADEYTNNCDECTGINVVNEANFDYRLTPNSTALIGKGSSENAPAYDVLGNVRPPGTIDIGAYQFSTSGSAPPPPPPPPTPPTPNPPIFE